MIQQEDDLRPVPAEKAGPLFCPRCRKPRQPIEGAGLIACPICGEALVAQGFCPVCDDFWPLKAGVTCPKHDVELESTRAASSHDGGAFRWVTVKRYVDSQAAQAPRIRLEDEGIPTFLEGERMGSLSMYGVATGGAKLKVPEHLAGDARIILSQTWSATAAALDIDEEYQDDEIEEEELAGNASKLSPWLRDLFILSFIAPPILMVLVMVLRWLVARG